MHMFANEPAQQKLSKLSVCVCVACVYSSELVPARLSVHLCVCICMHVCGWFFLPGWVCITECCFLWDLAHPAPPAMGFNPSCCELCDPPHQMQHTHTHTRISEHTSSALIYAISALHLHTLPWIMHVEASCKVTAAKLPCVNGWYHVW